jgi:hypothetical protein
MTPRLSLLLAWGMLLRGQAQCTEGEMGQEENCKKPRDVKEAMDVANEVADDMHMELLQRDLKLSNTQKKLEPETKKATVANWTCTESLAYQSMTLDDNSETKFQVLNMTNGDYGDIIKVNLDVIAPDKIRSMNGCARNLKDEKLYCVMQVNKNGNNNDNIGCFLVRIDKDSNLEYVTKLYNYRYSAAFDDDDTIYVGGQQNWNKHQLTVIKNVSTITGVSSYKVWDNGNNVAESKIGESTVTMDPSNFEIGADFEVIKANWEGTGNNSYLVSVSGANVVVVRVSPGPYKLWTLDHTSFSPPLAPASPARVWGAAWKWDNEFYASDDDAAGLYMLNKEKVNLYYKQAELVREANAAKTQWNDGFSCGPKPPGLIIVKDIGCEYDYYQVYKEGAAASSSDGSTKIRRMTEGTKWKDYFDVPMKNPKYGCDLQSLNACAVNGKNNKLYCQAQMECGNRLVTLDKDQLGFIMQSPGWCFSGIFDSHNSYWMYCYSYGLVRIDDIDDEKKYKVYEYAKGAFILDQMPTNVYNTFSNFGNSNSNSYNLIGADFVTYTDKDKTYLLSIPESKENYVSVVDISDPKAPNLVKGKGEKGLWESTGLYAPYKCHSGTVTANLANCGMKKNSNTYGSAWRLEKGQKIIFSRDETGELFEVDKLDFTDTKASFKFFEALGNASWHDGFSCNKNITGIDNDR